MKHQMIRLLLTLSLLTFVWPAARHTTTTRSFKHQEPPLLAQQQNNYSNVLTTSAVHLANSGALNHSEMWALKNLYMSTGGEKWNWRADHHRWGKPWNFSLNNEGDFIHSPCNEFWAAVECGCNLTFRPHYGLQSTYYYDDYTLTNNKECHITKIMLVDYGLEGLFPDVFYNLSWLVHLHLARGSMRGIIPPSISLLTNLYILDLNSNYLTGNINGVTTLVNLQYLYLFTNNFTQSVSSQITNLVKLKTLALYSNLLTNIFPSLVPMFNLSYLDVFNNKIRGQLPSSLGLLYNLNYIDFSLNHLGGTIPIAISSLEHLNYLDLGLNNNIYGTLPKEFGRLTSLLLLSVEGNALTSFVPKDYRNMSSLVTLILNNNMFTIGNTMNGTVDFVDYTKQKNLSVIDLSHNYFKGPLFTNVFLLPSLRTFAAVANCFSGTLPPEICFATKLQTLALDGLTSGDNCFQQLWPTNNFLNFSGRLTIRTMQGTVPSCIYRLPNLETIHLSGNGLLGHLPDSLSDSISYLSLSHNYLTGTISSNIQMKALNSLDLSFNKLGGLFKVVSRSFNISSSYLHLRVNRLSGSLPLEIHDAKDVAVLEGNIFSCSKSTFASTFGDEESSQAILPIHDPFYESFRCGSNSLDNNLYIYVYCASAVIIAILCIAYLTRKKFEGDCSFLKRQFLNLMLWASVEDELTNSQVLNDSLLSQLKGVRRLINLLVDIRIFVLIYGSISFLVLVVVYAALSIYAGTRENEYSWKITAAFNTGLSSTVVLLFFFALFLLLAHTLIGWRAFRNLSTAAAVGNQFDSYKIIIKQSIDGNIEVSHWSWIAVIQITTRILIFFLINIIIMIFANIAYIYILFNFDHSVQAIATYTLAVFKLFFNSFILPLLLKSKLLRVGLTPGEVYLWTKCIFGNTTFFLTILYVFNYIIAPCAATALTDSNCFLEVFNAPTLVFVIYSYQQCYFLLPNGFCAILATVKKVTSYPPPFLYNYSCMYIFLCVFKYL